jgi:hypothetical protein
LSVLVALFMELGSGQPNADTLAGLAVGDAQHKNG